MRTFAVVDLFNEKNTLPGDTFFSGTLQECYRLLKSYNEALNYSIFEAVNVFDGNGRTRENLVALRGLYADCDSGLPKEGWGTKPTTLVESSPGKYQAYWTFEQPLPATPENCREYLGVLDSLVWRVGGDRKARDLTRILRVPGFLNKKSRYKDRFPLVTLRYDDGPRYTLAALREVYGYIEQPKTGLVNQGRGGGLAQRAGEEKAIAALHKAIATNPPPDKERNMWTFKTAAFALVQLGLSESAVVDILDDYVLDMDDLETCVKHANKYAQRKNATIETEVDL